MEATVVVLKTTPESVLDDYRRLMHMAEYEGFIDKTKATIIKLNLSWTKYFPACSSQPWQLEGVVRTLLEDGFDRKCSLGFLHPQPGPADLPHLYDERYFCSRDSQIRGYDLYEADEANLRKTFRRRLTALASYFPGPAPRKVLDVGCALGYFLVVAAEAG